MYLCTTMHVCIESMSIDASLGVKFVFLYINIFILQIEVFQPYRNAEKISDKHSCTKDYIL